MNERTIKRLSLLRPLKRAMEELLDKRDALEAMVWWAPGQHTRWDELRVQIYNVRNLIGSLTDEKETRRLLEVLADRRARDQPFNSPRISDLAQTVQTCADTMAFADGYRGRAKLRVPNRNGR